MVRTVSRFSEQKMVVARGSQCPYRCGVSTSKMSSPLNNAAVPEKLASVAVTHGIRVEVQPRFSLDHSQPESSKFVFTYHVRVTNQSERRVRVMGRHWIIVDANGSAHEVKGEGVVGRQPELAPGENFEYASYCPLGTPWGTMEGTYECKAEDGAILEVKIARFYLVASKGEPVASRGGKDDGAERGS